MSKDAIMMAIDAGSSMDQLFSTESSRLKMALECFKLTLQQKLFNNSSHEIGFSIFGDNESDDGNNLLLKGLAKPTMDLVRKVVEMSNTSLKNDKKGGDIFSAIQFMSEHIAEHCKEKKYNKRAFIFTNGMGKTNYNVSELNKIIKQLQRNRIKLNIIAIDFMQSYDMDDNQLKGEIMLDKIQQHNAQLLMQLKNQDNDNIQIFPASLAIELYKKFRKRDVNPMALYRGTLQIAPGLNIEVSTFKAVRRERLKSLSKYDTTQQFNKDIPAEKEVVLDVNYIVANDEDQKLIDKQNQMNAYQYGPHLVPISEILQKGTKIYEEKNFKLLGFVDKSKIPRQCFMAEVDIVVPGQDAYSRKLFTSFVYSMISLNKYAIARYVPRNYKNGVNPKMVLLMPYRSADRQMMYLTELPTAEDVRDYPFNSLKQSSEAQKKLVGELVSKMMLWHREGDEEIEDLRIESTFNPTRQYFYQSIFHRIFNNSNQIPELDPIISNYIRPEQKIYTNTQDIMSALKQQFKLIKKEISKDKVKEKQMIIWKDILSESTEPTEGIKEEIDELVAPNKKFNFDEEDEENLNPAKPIASFKQMLSNNKVDLVEVALRQMVQYIEAKNAILNDQEMVQHIIDCCAELRKGCITQKQTEFWDSWLDNSRHILKAKVCAKIKSEGLGFINRSNQQVYKVEENLHSLQIKIDELD